MTDSNSKMIGNTRSKPKLPAHLALLHDIDNEIETLENDIEITPDEMPETTIHENPRGSIDEDSPSQELKLAQLLQPELIPSSQRYLRSHILICIVNMLTLSGFMGLRGILVTLHKDIGLYGLSLYYSWYALTTVIVASKINDCLGPRTTVVLSIICHSLFIVSNFLTCDLALLIGCGLAGIGSAFFYSAQSTYEKSLSIMYTSCTGANLTKITGLFASLTSLFSHFSIALGNLISSVVILHLAPYINDYFHQYSELVMLPNHNISSTKCDFWCKMDLQPSRATLLILYGTYGGLILLGMCFLVCFLVKLDVIYRTKTGAELCQPAVLGIFMMFVKPQSLLALGLATYLAYTQALLYGEFLKLFISCRLGIGKIGYVLMTYAVISCAASALCGSITRFLGRMAVYIIGFLISCGVLVALYTWDTTSSLSMAYFLLFGGLGASDGLLSTQLEVTMATVCRHYSDHPMTLIKVIQSATMAVVLSTSSFTCPGTRLLLAFGLLGLALGTSLGLEGVKDKRRRMTSSAPV